MWLHKKAEVSISFCPDMTCLKCYCPRRQKPLWTACKWEYLLEVTDLICNRIYFHNTPLITCRQVCMQDKWRHTKWTRWMWPKYHKVKQLNLIKYDENRGENIKIKYVFIRLIIPLLFVVNIYLNLFHLVLCFSAHFRLMKQKKTFKEKKGDLMHFITRGFHSSRTFLSAASPGVKYLRIDFLYWR